MYLASPPAPPPCAAPTVHLSLAAELSLSEVGQAKSVARARAEVGRGAEFMVKRSLGRARGLRLAAVLSLWSSEVWGAREG